MFQPRRQDKFLLLLCIIPAYLFIKCIPGNLGDLPLESIFINISFIGIIFLTGKNSAEGFPAAEPQEMLPQEVSSQEVSPQESVPAGDIRTESLIPIQTTPFKTMHYLLFGLSILFTLTIIITDNPLPKALALIFSFTLALYTLFLTAADRKAFEDRFPAVFWKVIFSIPMGGFKYAPKTLRRLFRGLRFKKAGQILFGFVLGLPLSVVVLALLMNADANFRAMLGSILDELNLDLWHFIVRLLFSLPVAFFLFGAIFANRCGKNAIELPHPDAKRIAPPFVLFSAITPVCFMYVLFFINQFHYFAGGFSGNLPNGFNHAEYARQGFFELCSVASINIFLIIVINALCKKENGKNHAGINIYSAFLSFSTVILVITAISKMVMYINRYGLSPLRVYTSWFMILLMLVFVIIIKGLITKSNIYPPVFIVFSVMLGILCFGDIDGFIAKYNTDMYKSGKLETIDVDLFYKLSDSAVPHAAALVNDPVHGSEIREYLTYKDETITLTFHNWNFSSALARRAIGSYTA